MRWLEYFRSSSAGRRDNQASSAKQAKDRLQVIIAHERVAQKSPGYLAALQRDLIEVIRRYVPIAEDDVRVNLERDGGFEVLELNITLPEGNPAN